MLDIGKDDKDDKDDKDGKDGKDGKDVSVTSRGEDVVFYQRTRFLRLDYKRAGFKSIKV